MKIKSAVKKALKYFIPGAVKVNKPSLDTDKAIQKKCTAESEINYFLKHDEGVYFDTLYKKFKFFKVEKVVRKNFGKSLPRNVVDIGGGKYGGALQFYKGGSKRILFDFIVEDLLKSDDSKLRKWPVDIELKSGDFSELPFEEEYFDIIFSWEALDHCDDKETFIKSVNEMCRVLNKQGLIFWEMPYRPKPISRHPISEEMFKREEIVNHFEKNGLKVIRRVNEGPMFGSPAVFALILTKPV